MADDMEGIYMSEYRYAQEEAARKRAQMVCLRQEGRRACGIQGGEDMSDDELGFGVVSQNGRPPTLEDIDRAFAQAHQPNKIEKIAMIVVLVVAALAAIIYLVS